MSLKLVRMWGYFKQYIQVVFLQLWVRPLSACLICGKYLRLAVCYHLSLQLATFFVFNLRLFSYAVCIVFEIVWWLFSYSNGCKGYVTLNSFISVYTYHTYLNIMFKFDASSKNN